MDDFIHSVIRTQAAQRISLFYPLYRQQNIERLAPKFNELGQQVGHYTELERNIMFAFIDSVRAKAEIFKSQALSLQDPSALEIDYSDLSP